MADGNTPHKLMRFFAYAHLPNHLQEISEPFFDLARTMDTKLPEGDEKDAGMRKLLEAKDCMVRANLPDPNVHVWTEDQIEEGKKLFATTNVKSITWELLGPVSKESFIKKANS